MSFQIAIDGPVAAGKGTVAKLLAERLRCLYVDTGAMYRCVALASIRAGVEPADEQGILEVVKNLSLDLQPPTVGEQDGRLVTVLMNGEDVSHEIREKKIDAIVSLIASNPKVRELLVMRQREIGGAQDVVIEGRDVATVVFPTAQLKIFLTASPDVRAKRRWEQHRQKYEAEGETYESIRARMNERDAIDTTRMHDPLRAAEDSVIIDTTSMTIKEVVEMILDLAETRKQNENNTHG